MTDACSEDAKLYDIVVETYAELKIQAKSAHNTVVEYMWGQHSHELNSLRDLMCSYAPMCKPPD